MSPDRMRQRLWQLQQRLAPYLFVSPFVLLFAAFLLWPLLRSLLLSLHKTVGSERQIFAGLDNYAFLLRDRFFWFAVVNTVGYALAFLLIQIPAALLLAVLLNSRRIRGRSLFRLAFFSTHLVGGAFVGIIFAQILNVRHGLLNTALSALLGRPVEIAWLSEPRLAMPSVLLAALWLSIGHGMVYFLAALQAVDRELYEAAAVDGAGRWGQFWNITLPGVWHVVTFLTLFGLIGAMQLFELPYILFGQSAGPGNAALTIVMYLYVYGIQSGDLGYAAAIGWMLVLLISGLAVAQWRIVRRREALP
ncbi:MAG: sugar ABC transporter permease [Phycisphaerae bacterium]|nr:sugar ABC transporter permease [Phycisphaerae bacterium]MDW8261993.1 sugar ABC transporter permease [Phycisphaerales bacterium]